AINTRKLAAEEGVNMGKLNWRKRCYAVALLCANTAVALPAQTLTTPHSVSLTPVVANETIALPVHTFTTLHAFNGTEGANPVAGLVQGNDGNFYGTTPLGGANGSGTVFRITPFGALTTLYSFCPQSGCTDGASPGGLLQWNDGNFYGTTFSGGANGSGTVFRITPFGALTTLYSFCSQPGCTDGASPRGLLQSSDGNLYGTTVSGGANAGTLPGRAGTVFKITLGGVLTTLYSFCSQSGCKDGQGPHTGVVQGSDGNFYGTTAWGGANKWIFSVGPGTVFKITPDGVLTTLHSFCSQPGCTDGADSEAALVQGNDGNFYGTTYQGGSNNGYGTVFRISPSGALTTLHIFCRQSCGDGVGPIAGLVEGSKGNFYGTTDGVVGNECSEGACGTVFEMTPGGALTTLYSFCSQSGCADGGGPLAGLVQGTDGNLYGTTFYGGASSACGVNGCGTVFSLSVGLGPFVETLPTSGKVGAVVKILGTNLTGATRVTFNGTAAPFKVVSGTEITTVVPFGATTGEVQVVTLRGTLPSNVNFQVEPPGFCPGRCFSPLSPRGKGLDY
ncbi:MAG: choice-of-anchor tandem repeat GloVer-containing protein, partial [Terriglobia bacterium]